ncbi:hypothetical protein KQY27_00070 [Methanobrevibacter sp. TMH8]|uniref:hypothetical protein n=1 Tax=Methanobrevibacter sp. TMH8 TaxID=2848611 RepID=UPI001CCBE8A9|nr:hypothetical protein [Methanobrevibacter sp. TMH8]MBZ9569953.1 hypothetical protein [Methanobrevibacter sp. TMH8]
MNKKNLILLVILFVGVAGLALSPVSADTKIQKTNKLYFKYNGDTKHPGSSFNKSISKKSLIYGYYNYNSSKNKDTQDGPNYMGLGISGKKSYTWPDYKPTKILVQFKKNMNGKTYYSSKIFTYKGGSDLPYGYKIGYWPKNNYKPYYAVFYYKKTIATKTTDKIYFKTKHNGDLNVKKIGPKPGDQIELRYNTIFPGTKKLIQTDIFLGRFADYPTNYKLLKATIMFVKKVGSKNYYNSKTFTTTKPNYHEISYNAKNGYKPLYAIVTYRIPLGSR